MATKKKLAGELLVGDRIQIPKNTIKIVEFKKPKYYQLPGETRGEIKCAEIEYTDGPLKGHRAVVVMHSSDKVDFVLKDPVLTRAFRYCLKGIKNAIKRHKKAQEKAPEFPLWT